MLIRAAVSLLVACLDATAGAAEICMSSVDDFRAAMAEALSSPGPHHLKIVAGDYLIPDDIEFVGWNGLVVEGGYAPGCLVRTFGAGTTTLRGPLDADHRPSFHAVDGDLTLSDLSLRDFTGGYIWADAIGAVTRLDRVALLTRASATPGSISMNPNQGSISLHETFVENQTPGCALDVHVFSGSGFSAQGSTFINIDSGPAICIYADTASATLSIRDSIAQSGSGFSSDIVQSGPAAIEVISTIYSMLNGTLAAASSGNLPGPVIFEAGADPLLGGRLADVAQPARDSATPNPDALLDILGHPRVSGGTPDRGAFELDASCDRIFGDGFGSDDCELRRRVHSRHARAACVASPETCRL